MPPELFNGLKWRLVGPFRGGRVVAVAGVSGDSRKFYFGGVNGGIWKTIDAGVTWTPIFDAQKVGSIGALAIAPSDPTVIYAGTGESDIREDLSTGDGVYKSLDGGSTWTHIGLEDTRQISRIVVDPRDANVVYVGSLGHAYGPNEERGVYKSVDGGAHWTRSLDLGPEIGVSDLALCSGQPRFLFAAAWHTHRPPWSVYAPTDGPGGGIYRSSDGGKSWTKLSGHGLPDGNLGRIGVDVAPDGRRVYALIEVKEAAKSGGDNPAQKADAKRSGLYRSDDGGDTWALANNDARLTGRAWYFNRVTIDPNHDNVIYMPNTAMYRSEDGGKTVTVLRGAPGGDDYHQLWIDPRNSASMVLGTDQGTTVSLNRGETWSTWYNQPTAQFYHVTTDNNFPYSVYGTQQDSGSAGVVSRTNHAQITPRDWFVFGESESGYVVVDPNDSNIVYLSGTYGVIDRYDRRVGLSQDISPWPAATFESEIPKRKFRDPWTPMLAASPLDSGVLYLGTQYVMKTDDGGLHWETISPDLTGATRDLSESSAADKNDGLAQKEKQATPTGDAAKRGAYGVVYAIAPSPLNREVIWAGSDTGLIHLTRDGAKSWKNVTPPGLSAWSKISMIEASHFDPAIAYAAVDRGRLDDRAPHYYRTRDFGATWQPITQGIAAPAFARVLREDPLTKGLLFAGTEFGVYVSFDDGDHWQPLQLNLPVSSVRDLAIHLSKYGDDLVAATFGRSFWILDDLTPLRQAMAAERSGGPWLYRPQNAVRVDNDGFPGTPLPPEEPTAENPPAGAVIDYFLPEAVKSIQLEILDAHNDVVRRFSSEDEFATKHAALPVAERWFPKPLVLEKGAGMHRFVWDLAWKSSGGSSVDEEASTTNPAGPKAAPGSYQVRVTFDGKTQSQPLAVLMDPRSTATTEVLAQQWDLGKRIYDETVEARRAMAEMDSVQKRLAEMREKGDGLNERVRSLLAEAEAEIGAIQNGGGKAQRLQDAYTGLASSLRVVEGGDRAIPAQAIAVYQESSVTIKERIAEWSDFKRTKLTQLNRRLGEAKLSPLEISSIDHEIGR